MSNIGSVSNATLGMYPGSEHKFDSLFAQNAQAVVDGDQTAPTRFSGAAWDVEGQDMGDEAMSTMYQALSMQRGNREPTTRAMEQYVEDSDASCFDTDLTSLDALARNARYADQVGNL